MRTLRRNTVGQDVLDAQCALARAGFYAGDMDGDFGAGSAAAVQAFQTARQLSPTGELDPASAAMLGLADRPVAENPLPAVTPDAVRSLLFPQTPPDNIGANLAFVLQALAGQNLTDQAMLSLALAILRTEAATFLPVSEHACLLNTAPGGPPFGLYASRLGNHGTADASTFRGRGFIQVTGRANYREASRQLFGDDRLLQDPLSMHSPDIAARVFARFLKSRERRLRAALAANNLQEARAAVNGGLNGQATFELAYTAARQLPALLAA